MLNGLPAAIGLVLAGVVVAFGLTIAIRERRQQRRWRSVGRKPPRNARRDSW